MRWWSFGSPRDNWAFVNANRTAGPRGDRILLEVANLATGPRSTTLRVETGDPAREIHRSEIRLAPFESHRLVIEVPEDQAGGQVVRAFLDDDDLSFDNAVALAPAERKIVRYDIKLGDKKIRKLVERAMQASGAATPSNDRPHLLFHDADLKASSDEAWGVRMMAEADAEAYLGPFVLDRSHPLTDGISLSGVIWAAGKNQVAGAPIVMAGNIPLLTDTESAGGRHDLKLRLRPDISTLPESPAWPTLMWNLVRWRASALPGLDQPNIHLGQEATWTLSSPSDAIEVTRPDGKSANVPARGRRVVVRADEPGIYKLRAGEESAQFSANPLHRDESDLTQCASGRWGDELDATALRLDYRDIRWALILLALAIVTLHLVLVKRIAR